MNVHLKSHFPAAIILNGGKRLFFFKDIYLRHFLATVYRTAIPEWQRDQYFYRPFLRLS